MNGKIIGVQYIGIFLFVFFKSRFIQQRQRNDVGAIVVCSSAIVALELGQQESAYSTAAADANLFSYLLAIGLTGSSSNSDLKCPC